MTIHVVQAGETVGSIAESYGVDPARLAADNAVPPSGALAVGQTLVVRFPRQVHAVRAGETLASIAEAYGTTVRRLWQNNWPLGGGAALQPGQVLVISYFDEPLGAAAFNGYAYPYIDMSLLDAELPYLTYLTPFTYGITADGDLLQLEDDALLSAARQRGVRPVMHLVHHDRNRSVRHPAGHPGPDRQRRPGPPGGSGPADTPPPWLRRAGCGL